MRKDEHIEKVHVQKASAWCRAENARSERVMIKRGMTKVAYIPKYQTHPRASLEYQVRGLG